jgi:hypothetical protein
LVQRVDVAAAEGAGPHPLDRLEEKRAARCTERAKIW